MSRRKEPVLRRIGGVVVLVLFLPIIVPLVLLAFTLYWLHKVALYVLVWVLWLPKGKDVLYICSDSPIWHEYMDAQILPLIQHRAVVLNWSQRSKWPRWSFEVHVFRSLGGDYDFNPMVVLFRPFRPAKVVRFWSAFKDWKRGDPERVKALREELLALL